MMESIRNSATLFDGTRDDVWDRARALAPSSRPVGVPLFRKPAAQAWSPVPTARLVTSLSDLPATVTPVRKINWERLPIASPDALARRSPVGPPAHLERGTPVSMAFDLLRTRLLQTLKANDWRKVAVASPSPGCGSTFAACNLAVSLSRLASCKTVLMDLNFRAPGVARTLGLSAHGDLRRFLIGEVPLTNSLARYGANLALGLAGFAEAEPTEILLDPRASRTLDALEAALAPDIILYDLPPMLAYDDVAAFLPSVDGVLLVTDGTQTVARQIAECERMIDGQTKLLGVVLNRARDAGDSDLRYHNAQ